MCASFTVQNLSKTISRLETALTKTPKAFTIATENKGESFMNTKLLIGAHVDLNLTELGESLGIF